MSVNKFHRIIIALAVVIYCITAYNSNGYIHEDEHYQIIEFARLKSGVNQVQDLAWEYTIQVRSAIQPLIAYTVFSICNKISITDPYTLAFILRLLSAMLAIYIITQFVRSTLSLIELRFQRFYIFIAYLLWFLPFLNVRFSSEAWAGLFCMWAVATALKNKGQYCFIGSLLGLAFLFRFQTIILSVSLLSWLLFIKKDQWKNIIKIAEGITIVVLAGIAIDYWFYGEFTLTPYNYFYANIILDIASKFGISPWYDYIKAIVIRPSMFIGIPILFSLVILFIKDRKNLFLWLTIPFLIIHSIIPHKEFRFLFPIANFIPILLLLAYQQINWTKHLNPKVAKLITNSILILLFIGNGIALFAVAIRAADGRVAISKYIHTKYSYQPISIVYSRWADYFTPRIPANFYKEENATLIQLDSLSTLQTQFIDTTQINFYVLRRGLDTKLNKKYGDLLKNLGYIKEMQSIPVWIERLGIPCKMVYENDILELYRKQ
ncbi:MAG: hypothetical protein V4556_01215 [Bacteroidota bacterium]